MITNFDKIISYVLNADIFSVCSILLRYNMLRKLFTKSVNKKSIGNRILKILSLITNSRIHKNEIIKKVLLKFCLFNIINPPQSLIILNTFSLTVMSFNKTCPHGVFLIKT